MKGRGTSGLVETGQADSPSPILISCVNLSAAEHPEK